MKMKQRQWFDRARAVALRCAISVTALATVQAIAPAAQAQTVAVTQFDIAPQSLGGALAAFTRKTGITLAYGGTLPSVTSHGATGEMSSAEALSHILAGSGLTYRFTGANSVTLEPAPRSAKGTVQLGPVRVEGADGSGTALLGTSVSDPTSTEGTKSYAAAYSSVGSKTATSLREVPQSVSVITRQRLEDQNLTTIDDVMGQTTGITLFQGTLVNSRFMSRGFEIISARKDGGAAIMAPSGIETDMAFYDHVEVLRGSDGLFGGQGEPGGTINLVRKKPTAQTQVLGEVHAGSWNNYRAQLDVSGPVALDGAVRARMVAAYHTRDYFQRGADIDRKLLYGVIEADASPTTLIRVGMSYDDTRTSTIGYGLPRLTDGGDLRLPRRLYLAGAEDGEDRHTYEYFGRIEQQLGGGWKATVDATFSHYDQDRRTHFYYGAVDPLTGSGFGGGYGQHLETDRHRSIDASLAGDIHLFGRTHQLIVGGTWQSFDQKDDASQPIGDYYEPVANIFTFDPNDYPQPTNLYLQAHYPYAGRANKGLYGSLKVDVSDRLKIIGGGRLSWFDYNWSYIAYNSDGTEAERYQSVYKEKGIFTPYAALTYDFAQDWTAYASYAETFKSQAAYLSADFKPLAAVRGSTYELGVKGALAEGRLNMTAALYRIDRNGQAVRDPAYPPSSGQLGSTCCYIAQGLVRSQGIDTEISGEIAPGWQLTAGYTFNSNKNRASGLRYETLTPRHLFKLFTSYRLGGDFTGLTLGGGVQAQTKSSVRDYAYLRGTDGVLTGETIDAQFTQKGYSIWNAFATYAINDHLNINGNLNNIFDKRYYSTIGYLDYGNWYGAPRNFLVTLRAKY